MMRRAGSWVTLSVGLLGCLGCVAGPSGQASREPAGTYGLPPPAPGFPERAALREPAQISTLEDCVAYAALHNPALQAAWHRWQAALHRVPQARALPDPKASYEVMGRTGLEQQTLGVSQMLPWFGKLKLSGQMAEEEARAAQQEYEAEQLKVFREIKDAYYEYYYLGRAVAVVRGNIELLTRLEEALRTRYKVGEAEYADLIRAQVELGKLDNELRSLRDMQGPIVARLNAALNRPSASEVPWPQGITEQRLEVSDEQVLVWAAESNPELKMLDRQITREERGIELAARNYYPDVELGLKYLSPMNMAMPGRDGISAMVSVNIPIWRDKFRAAELEARERRHAAAQARADRQNRLTAEIQRALYQLRDARRRIGLFRDTLLPKGRQSLMASETAFRAGKASFLDLVDAQRQLLEFELSYERALADAAQRRAELEMLVGKDIPRAAGGAAGGTEQSASEKEGAMR